MKPEETRLYQRHVAKMKAQGKEPLSIEEFCRIGRAMLLNSNANGSPKDDPRQQPS